MAANITISFICPGDAENNNNRFYTLKRSSVSWENTMINFNIAACTNPSVPNNIYISSSLSSIEPKDNSTLYTDSALKVPFNGENKIWVIEYSDGVQHAVVIGPTGNIIKHRTCPPIQF